MIRAVASVVLVLLLAACGSAAPPPTRAEAECRAAAYDDPAVKELENRRNGNDTTRFGLQHDQQLALEDATRHCMQQKGLAPPGGVERVRQPS